MKVLFFIDNLQAGGKERQLVELLKGLSKHQEINCILVVMDRSIHYEATKSLNIKIHYLIRKNKKDPRIFFRLYEICKEERPDIIHTLESMASVYVLPVAKILGIKLINGMIRNAPLKLKPFGKAWIRSKITFPFSDVIVSNSYAGIKSYRAPSNKSGYIHNGFDIKRIKIPYNKKELKAQLSIDTNKIIGMIAKFSDKKDYKTYIKSAQMILGKRDDVTFLTVGDGPNYEKCRKLVKSQFYQKIRFLGKQESVEPIIDMFDIGVLATYTEGISNSIIEYMALGKPVIATDCEGTKELVLNGKTGFLVNPGDEIDLSNRIIQLLDNTVLANEMGTAGKDRIYKEFNLEKMVNSYVFLYKSILRAR